MAKTNSKSKGIEAALQALAARLAAIEKRLDAIEASPPPPPAPQPGVDEETVALLAAAIAAFLGKRARIRHVRLLGSAPWAQQGRVSIQASHQLEAIHG